MVAECGTTRSLLLFIYSNDSGFFTTCVFKKALYNFFQTRQSEAKKYYHQGL